MDHLLPWRVGVIIPLLLGVVPGINQINMVAELLVLQGFQGLPGVGLQGWMPRGLNKTVCRLIPR